jgi:hypothetical protein
MLQCWNYLSRRRPSFADMVTTIDIINGNISSEVSYNYRIYCSEHERVISRLELWL